MINYQFARIVEINGLLYFQCKALCSNFQCICYFIAEKEIKTAVKEGNLDVLNILLNNRQDKNPVVWVGSSTGSEYTVLHYAAYKGQLGIIKWYKDALNFSNINPEDNKGNTPLSFAIEEGKQSVVDYFFELGYGQNATSKTT